MSEANDRNVNRAPAQAARRAVPAKTGAGNRAASGGRRGAPAKKRAPGRAQGGFDAQKLLASAKRAASGAAAVVKRAVANRRKAQAGKAKKKRGNLLKSRFYRVYIGLVALAAVLIVIGTVWLHGVLADYESAQPIHVAEEVAKVFEARDFEALYTMDNSAQSIADGDRDFYINTMRDVVGDKPVSWSEAFSTEEDVRRYNVNVGSDRFASFTLVPSGEKTPKGNVLWKLGEVDTNVVTEAELDETLGDRIEFQLTVPEGSTVTVDGEALPAEDIVQSGITKYPTDFLPPEVKQPSYARYRFDCRNENPEISVVDASGASQTLRETGEHTFTCEPEENAEFREKYASGIMALAQKLAKFTAADVTQGAMLSDVVDDSPAYTLVRKFDNRWAPTHKYAEFNDMAVSDCILWSDKCFTCHVTFDFVLRTRRGTEQTYATAYTFCIVNRGGKAKIYNLLMN